jgi:hypothetical protein
MSEANLNITFRSPKPIKDLDGYVLAMVLRIYTTGKTFAERSITDGVSVLTKDNLAHVARVYAYFQMKINREKVFTRGEFDELLPTWGLGVEEWCDTHESDIDQARKYLQDYMDVPAGEYPARQGFNAWDVGGR